VNDKDAEVRRMVAQHGNGEQCNTLVNDDDAAVRKAAHWRLEGYCSTSDIELDGLA